MTAARLLTRLYPPAVRERWGEDIGREVAEAGARSWPDTLAGAVRLWLRPSEWPETAAGQTRRVLAVALFAIIGVTTLLLRAITPTAALTADVRHPVTSLWLVPVLVGIGLATPMPPLRWVALRRLSVEATRTLAAPGVAVLALFALAHSGALAHNGGLVRVVPLAYYWGTLGFVALRGCTLVARVSGTATMPTTRRLRAALLLVGAGLCLAAAQNLLAVVRAAPHAGPLAVTLGLGVVAVVTLRAGQDLGGAGAR